jgi:hypothetical protein
MRDERPESPTSAPAADHHSEYHEIKAATYGRCEPIQIRPARVSPAALDGATRLGCRNVDVARSRSGRKRDREGHAKAPEKSRRANRYGTSVRPGDRAGSPKPRPDGSGITEPRDRKTSDATSTLRTDPGSGPTIKRRRSRPHRFRDNFAVDMLARPYDVTKTLGDTIERHYTPFVKELRDRVRWILDTGVGLEELAQNAAGRAFLADKKPN